MTLQKEIVLVDDEPNIRRVLQAALENEGYKVYCASNGMDAIPLLTNKSVSLLISDIRMPQMDGIELLQYTCDNHPDIPIILLTAHGTVDSAVEAMKQGAFDYITKPFDMDELRQTVKKALNMGDCNRKSFRLQRKEVENFHIVGDSKAMEYIYEIISKIADTPSRVLITGESGTGKELVARALHAQSSRKDKPFIAINCAAIPSNLMESELFGYEKGAFTGAVSSKPGRFELAHEGTLFLDEIGEIPIEMQVKLLRVLQLGHLERVGGLQSTNINVRVIAATNQNLVEMIQEGTFREDLYYRLNVVPIQLPPLRERAEDVSLLATYFLKKFNQKLGKSVQNFSNAAMKYLQDYSWPGNIRELENVIERSILFSDGKEIQEQDLPPEILAHSSKPPLSFQPVDVDENLSLPELWKQQKEKLETEVLSKTLEQTGGNVTKAAEKLGISRKSVQKKMKELGLRDEKKYDSQS